jgi:catechol 2,3-dioxygenase-like lactoylglutathione lyase family enzyme
MKLQQTAAATVITCLALLTPRVQAAEIPYTRIDHVGVSTSDAGRADRFLRDVLGFDSAPESAGAGRYYKVNDGQFVEIFAARITAATHRVTHFSLAVSGIQAAAKLLRDRGVAITDVSPGDDRSLHCAFKDPDGNRIVLTQVMGGSLQDRIRGKLLHARRISTHLDHVGLQVADLDASTTFYRDKLGLVAEVLQRGKTRWVNMHLPGSSGDYIQLLVNTDAPSERRWPREHFGFTVSDAHATHKLLMQRGVPPNPAFTPVVGYAGRLKINFVDPDDTLIEMMEIGAAKASDPREP